MLIGETLRTQQSARCTSGGKPTFLTLNMPTGTRLRNVKVAGASPPTLNMPRCKRLPNVKVAGKAHPTLNMPTGTRPRCEGCGGTHSVTTDQVIANPAALLENNARLHL